MDILPFSSMIPCLFAALLLTEAGTSPRTEMYAKRVVGLADQITDDFLIHRAPATSTVGSCALFCVREPSCDSFFFNKNKRVCQLHSQQISAASASLTSMKGSSYYKSMPQQVCQVSLGYRWEANLRLCFKVNYEQRTFHESTRFCRNDGGHLLVIDSEATNQYIKEFLTSVPAHNNSETRYFVGGINRENEGKWIFSNGTEMDSFNWDSDQPDDTPRRNCITVGQGRILRVHDRECDRRHFYICQIDAVR